VLSTKPQKEKKPKRESKRKDTAAEEDVEVRRSQRPRNEVSYVYKDEREGSTREPIDYTEKIKQLQLDAEEAEKMRAELEAKRAAEDGKEKKPRADGKSRGPKDSGKGVRVQVRAGCSGLRAQGRRVGWGGGCLRLVAAGITSCCR